MMKLINPNNVEFTVILREYDSIGWTYFLVNQADSVEHAEEQASDAYPNCEILWVNEGEEYDIV